MTGRIEAPLSIGSYMAAGIVDKKGDVHTFEDIVEVIREYTRSPHDHIVTKSVRTVLEALDAHAVRDADVEEPSKGTEQAWTREDANALNAAVRTLARVFQLEEWDDGWTRS